MKYFSVLIVDDKLEELEFAKSELASEPAIRPKTAANLAAAEELVRDEFFHLALVDPRLHKGNDNIFDGFLLLNRLKKQRASCTRLILAHVGRNDADGALPIVAELNPITGCAQGIVDKITEADNTYLNVVREKAKQWLSNPLEIEGAETAAQKLEERWRKKKHLAGNKRSEAGLTEEIDFLVSRLFGQGELWNRERGGLGIKKVKLESISQEGFSSAVVMKAQCFSTIDDSVPGIACILKFAAVDYVERELVRYSRYVRYRLDVHHRVELLGWGFGDVLGVLCYNFAGKTSLSDLFLRNDDGFFQTLNKLFGSQSWHKERCDARLKLYFQEAYGTRVPKALDKIKIVVGDLVKKFQGSKDGHGLKICEHQLHLPGDILVEPIFEKKVPGCIVHGDLHCNNLIVGADARPMFIDYHDVADGPRAVDFATMEGSVRLLGLMQLRPEDGAFIEDPRPDQELIPKLFALAELEQAVWEAVWRSDGASDRGRFTQTRPGWVDASIHIGRLARNNFPADLAPPEPAALDEREYAATCLMWAMRLFMVEKLPERELARLLVWISTLVSVLKRKPVS